MCGIIGFIPKNPKFNKTGKEIVTQYQRQMGRGSRGFGLMSIYQNKVEIDRATEPTKAILDSYMSQAPIQFFHHRMPTSTENELEQTHPFLITHDELAFDYYLLHNGVIRNADELLKIHTEELGYVYRTLKTEAKGSSYYYSTYKKFNDSEALAVEAARYFDGKSNEIGAMGTIAFVMLKMTKKTHKPVELIWSRNGGNPIEMVQTKEGLLIASEVYHEDAELVPDNTFEVVDLNKYFNSKKSHSNIIKLIKAGDANYKTPPPVAPVTRPAVGFGSHTLPEKTSSNATTTSASKTSGKDDERDDEVIYATPREKAFARMADRVIADLTEEIYVFFENLAYADATDDEIMSLANDFNDVLIEKAEIARNKVRPFYDHKEDQEMGHLLDFDDTPDAHAAIDEDDEDYASYSASVNDRADEQTKRFQHLID
jgi:predicted glutamine amidotransferase